MLIIEKIKMIFLINRVKLLILINKLQNEEILRVS